MQDPFLKEALAEAKKGLASGGIPIGSVLVHDGRILGLKVETAAEKTNADWLRKWLKAPRDFRLTPDMITRPEVGATVRYAMGAAYRGLAEFDKADAQLATAFQDATQAYGGAHPEVASILHEQAQLRHIQARYPEALELCRRSLEMRRALLGPDHVEIAVAELLDHHVEHRLVDVGQHDLHALGGEPLTERSSDPTGTTGHDGDLPGQVLHARDSNPHG